MSRSKNRITERQLREIRKDMLRARAQIERHGLARSGRRLADDLTPGSLLRSLVPVRLTSKRPTDWLLEGAGLVKRYPYLVSVASALFSGLRRRRGLWRVGAGLLFSLALARGARKRSWDDEHA